MTELWIADWTFYYKKNKWELKYKTLVIKGVITKRIPVRHLLNDKLQYNRAVRDIEPKTMSSLEDDVVTHKKRVTIMFTKKLTEI